ncbi:MAG TPA: hypothetical protein VM369_07980 [Candidatus Binatia bacterium]|nr:hypothetical protein [Candidatus Binatia bacterium]
MTLSTLRVSLWIAVAVNLTGTYLFLVPGSAAGQLAGLPWDVPLLYRAMVAMFIFLLAGMYAWLARQERVVKPMVAAGAIGKASAFIVVFALWQAGEASGRAAFTMIADLLLAAAWLAWLIADGRASRPAR